VIFLVHQFVDFPFDNNEYANSFLMIYEYATEYYLGWLFSLLYIDFINCFWLHAFDKKKDVLFLSFSVLMVKNSEVALAFFNGLYKPISCN